MLIFTEVPPAGIIGEKLPLLIQELVFVGSSSKNGLKCLKTLSQLSLF